MRAEWEEEEEEESGEMETSKLTTINLCGEAEL